MIPRQKVEEIIEIRKEKLIRGKRTYTNKIRINELNLIRKKLLEEENFDNLNPTKEKEAMAVATFDSLQKEITKAINKQIGTNIDIGIDIGKSTDRSGQARMMEFGG